MDDRSLYATILGLEAPWEVERVELKATEQVVHLWVRALDGTSFVTIPRARAFFARWYAWASRSRLAPMRYLATTLRRHLENILTPSPIASPTRSPKA